MRSLVVVVIFDVGDGVDPRCSCSRPLARRLLLGIGIDKKDVSQGLTCLSPWGMDGMKKQRESPGMSSSSPLFSPSPRQPIEPFLFDVDTDMPANSDHAYSDIMATVTLLAGPKVHI